MSKKRKCRRCFRCTGLGRGIVHNFGIPSYSFRPKRDEVPICTARREVFPNGCDNYEPRWKWNLEQFLYWRVRYTLDRAWCFFVRVPIGKLRKPKKIDFHAEPYPVCPRCGEIPYRVDYCVFCGQRFRT